MSRTAQLNEVESTSPGGPVGVFAQVVGVEPDRLPSFLDGLTMTAGSLSLPRGTAAVSEDRARRAYVTLGGTSTFAYRSYNITGNETITRLNVTVGGLFGPPSSFGSPIGGPFYGSGTALVGIEDVSWYEQQLGVLYGGNFLAGEIRILPDRLPDPYHLASAPRNLAPPYPQIDAGRVPFQ